MTKVGVLHENARISRRFWRELISLMSIWTNYTIIRLQCMKVFRPNVQISSRKKYFSKFCLYIFHGKNKKNVNNTRSTYIWVKKLS